MISRLVILILAAGASLVPAQDRAPVEPASLPAPDQPVEPVKPAVEKLDDTRFRIGKVVFDKKNREVRFPTKVNMVEGLLEYLVVHQNGKVHESLLTTDVSPTQINLAMTLLRYPASRELYPLPSETGGASNNYPDVPADVKAGARVAIDVEWNDNGRTRRNPVNDWIQHAVKTTAMPPGPWIYGGSEFFDGKFVPETTGDISAIFVSPAALINYAGDDNRDDTVWLPYPKRVPAEGTNVTVIISPYSSTKPLPKP
jgi:hypothetical protein